MKCFLLVCLLTLLPASAFAQCNGIFANNTVCGNATGASNLPRPTNPSAFLGAAGGSNGQIQYNNNGALGGLTDAAVTARIALFTAIASGAVPASGGGVTNFLRADGTFAAPIFYAATRAALKAVDTTTTTQVTLTEAGRTGLFIWTTGNYTTAIATDTNEGVYIKADAIAASAGAWVRQFDFTNFQTQWFGALADYSTDSTAIINSMIAVGNIQNTNVANGAQTAIHVNVQGGVKFASESVSWLPSANWIFVYINYFANSDTTKGVSTGGGGTNELMQMSINSGYPGDVTGALVSEKILASPLHPAVGVNLNKNVNNSIYLHSGITQSIQPNAVNNAATATGVLIKDENTERFRISYVRYGTNDAFNGVSFSFQNRATELVCSGCDGAGAWGANIPATGAVVRGITTSSRYVITGSATDILQTHWLTGTAVPGEFLMNERAIFKGSISGTTLTVTSMLQGTGNIAVGQTIVGMYPQSGMTAATTITGLGTGSGGTGTYTVNNSQTLAATQIVSGYVAATNISGGGVVNTDTLYTPLHISMVGHIIVTNATFANAGPCVSVYKGALKSITDSSTATWGANIAGGGANQVLAYCNGTNWTVTGK
jgi:hypothetical protein